MKRTPLIERLSSRIVTDDRGCWVYTGAINDAGYGVIGSGGRGGRTLRTHRVIYEVFVGPIPHGLDIDHLCRNRACCNPDHLEPVTKAENVRRAFANHSHCPRGHELPPKAPPGNRRGQCRACKSEYDRRRWAERNAS